MKNYEKYRKDGENYETKVINERNYEKMGVLQWYQRKKWESCNCTNERNGSPAIVPTKEMGVLQWYQRKKWESCNGTNKRILTIQQLRKQLDFYNLLKKASKEISLNYDFHGVSRDFQGVSSNFKGFENNSKGVSREGFYRGMATLKGAIPPLQVSTKKRGDPPPPLHVSTKQEGTPRPTTFQPNKGGSPPPPPPLHVSSNQGAIHLSPRFNQARGDPKPPPPPPSPRFNQTRVYHVASDR